MTMTVPKIIWQTHNYEFEKLPDHLKMVIKTWTNLNPGWEHKYMDHNQRDEVIKKYPKLYEFYIGNSPVRQADIWRYVITYENGGVYSDMDSVCIKPLDYLLDNTQDCEILLTRKDPPSFTYNGAFGVNNANFAVKKDSNIMKDIIEEFLISDKTWEAYNFVVLKSDNAIEGFTSSLHKEYYKTDFDTSFQVDDYGDVMSYGDYLIKHSLSVI
jgi:mannosyltransferase OCH1-like enzyme